MAKENKSLMKVISEMMKAINGKDYEITVLSKPDDFPAEIEYVPEVKAFSTKILYSPYSSESALERIEFRITSNIPNVYDVLGEDSPFLDYLYCKQISASDLNQNGVICDELMQTPWHKATSDEINIFTNNQNVLTIINTGLASYLDYLPSSGIITYVDTIEQTIYCLGLDIKCLKDPEFMANLNLAVGVKLGLTISATFYDSNDNIITDINGYYDDSYYTILPTNDDMSNMTARALITQEQGMIINGTCSAASTPDFDLNSDIESWGIGDEPITPNVNGTEEPQLVP